MSAYPSTIKYDSPVEWNIRTKTLYSNFEELGEEQRKQKWLYPRRDINLKYTALDKSDAETIWEFYIARMGGYEAFSFFESTGAGSAGYATYSGEYVGTGDSTTLVFNLPAVDSSSVHTVYVAGSTVDSTSYTFSAGGGPDGEDKITFIGSSTGGPGPPTSTERVTYDFTGRLKIRCRFAEDTHSFTNMYDRLISHGITLKGLLNDE